MFERIISSLSILNDEFILNESKFKTSQIEWKIYHKKQFDQIQQIIKRFEIIVRSNSKFVFFNEKKSFFIKIQKIQSTNFHEKFHAKWRLFVRIMKNQFVINQCDQRFFNFNQLKILYVEIFLKKNIFVQLLWQAKIIENFDRIYIWLKFKDFLKINIKEAIRRKKNVFDKYMKYEQKLKQNIAKYEIQRIALKIELIVNLKFNDEMNFQNLITNLREKNKNYVVNQNLTIKIFIMNRLKSKEDREYEKSCRLDMNVNAKMTKWKKLEGADLLIK